MLPADSRSNPNNIFIIFSNTSTKPSLPFVMPISYHDTTTPLQTFHPFLSVVMTCSSHFGVPSGDQLYLVIPNHPRNPDGRHRSNSPPSLCRRYSVPRIHGSQPTRYTYFSMKENTTVATVRASDSAKIVRKYNDRKCFLLPTILLIY